jgi:hypothetical protein
MSHFFTKDKQTQLELLSDSIDLANLATAAEGQVLKANADGLFTLASDSEGSMPAVGADGEVLMVVDGAWVSQAPPAGGDGLPVPGVVGRMLVSAPNEDGDGFEWVIAAQPSIPSSLDDLVDPSVLSDGDILKVSGGAWVVSADATGDALPDGGTDGDMLIWDHTASAWQAQAGPESPAPDDENLLCTSDQIVRWGQDDVDTSAGGETDVIDVAEKVVVIVLDDWSTATGTATLRLVDPVVGRQVYIKNNSDDGEDESRTVVLVCGDGSGSTGSIDGQDNVAVELPERGTIHLVCIDATQADGEWIIL